MTPRPADDNIADGSAIPQETGEWSSGDPAPISRRAADILDLLNDSVSAFDREWRWVYINPAAKAVLAKLGKQPEQMIGRVLWDELPMLIGTQFEHETRRAAETGTVVEYEEYLPELDAWYEMRIVPARGLITTHTRDITHRRNAERSAELSADRARRLLKLATHLGTVSAVQAVIDAALREALEATEAQAGSVAMVYRDAVNGDVFEMVATLGYNKALTERYRRFAVTPNRPLSEAVNRGELVLIESKAAWMERFDTSFITVSELPGEAMASIPISVDGVVVAGLSLTFREPRRFDPATRTFLATIGEQSGIALARARAFERERKALEASTFLAEASRLLVSSLDYEATLRTLADAAVPKLGDWCAVDVVAEPDSPTWPPVLERLAVVHRDPEKLTLAAELERRYPNDWSSNDGVVGALRSGKVTFVPAITDEMLAAATPDPDRLELLRRFGFSAVIIVPLVARGRTLGALTLIHSESNRSYEQADLDLAIELAQRAAMAIDNARLYRDAERARADAERANAAKSDFLATMSHELRTPLNAIGGYSDLLEMGLHGEITEQQREAIGRIKRAHRNLLRLVEDVLSFARIESGRLEYAYTDVPLHEVLSGLDAFLAPQVAARQLAYVYTPVDPALTVHADREKLEQVLLNLLVNAIKFTEAGTVSLGATVEGSEVAIRVVDTGIGIPSEKREAIFAPFVQLESGLTRRAQGSGLGLAISRDIARAMGGDITVESTVGGGSTFTLRLPRRA